VREQVDNIGATFGPPAVKDVGATFGPPTAISRSGSSAERACRFILAKVKARSGHRFHQGSRNPPLACRSNAPELRFLAAHRVHRIPVDVARALLAWGDGFPVELLGSVPSAREVLAFQARGKRCVSLLPDGSSTAPHVDALAFALHDLCHLDKLIDPVHHLGQVGFFACFHAAASGPLWAAFEASFDEAFRRDLEHVAADMNGSAVFLFAALKMKLKMAVRRRLAADRGQEPPHGGPLTFEESRAYEEQLSYLLQLLDFEQDVLMAARVTSAKRDDARAALVLLSYFERWGRCVLVGRASAST
jgi:hypothetical protein